MLILLAIKILSVWISGALLQTIQGNGNVAVGSDALYFNANGSG
jgi:hypothetical protein